MEEHHESLSILSAQPPVDHQSLDSTDDQLNVLSLQLQHGVKISTDSNEGACDGANLEKKESEEDGENRTGNEVENVNPSENRNGISKGDREKSRRSRFPVRPNAEDCSYYLRTGMCKFGMNCKFNHPLTSKTQVAKLDGMEESIGSGAHKVKERNGPLDEEGQVDCKYFDRPGGCKFGKACKFNHSRKTYPALELNFMGLPIRLGEKECPYYMRNGLCKYGAICKFNHPDPTSVGGPDAVPAYSNGGSTLSSNVSQSTLAPLSPPASLNESPPYVPLMFSPTRCVTFHPEWTAYQNMNMPPAYAMKSQSWDRNVYMHQQGRSLVLEFPERPGQPECSFFIKTGNCKYKSACKFHHPKSATGKSSSCDLTDLGLPLRPGENVCSYYYRYGICKYGPACKYDHPIDYAHSAPQHVLPVHQTSVLGNSVVNDAAVGVGAAL